MNTIKTIITLSLLAAAGARAGEAHDAYNPAAVVDQVSAGMQQTAIDWSDNRGMSLLFDDHYKSGQVVVSGVSKLARQAGVLPGDVLKSMCTKPASLRHFGELAAVAGDAKVDMTINGQLVRGKIPAAAVKIDGKQRVLLTQAMSFIGTGPAPVVNVQAGAEVSRVCVPVHTVQETVSVAAPFEHRLIDGHLVAGGWVPKEYRFERYSYGLPVVVPVLTDWNPPQKIAAK